jgi:hypothetical protein
VALTFVILAVVLLLPVGLSWAETLQARRAACKTVCVSNYEACKADARRRWGVHANAIGYARCTANLNACEKKCRTIDNDDSLKKRWYPDNADDFRGFRK